MDDSLSHIKEVSFWGATNENISGASATNFNR